MNPLAKIFIYVVAIVLLAALLSPPIYWAAQALAGWGILPMLAEFPFHRFFSRIAQISALVLLWPVIRWLNVRSLRELGLGRNPQAFRDLATGIGLALGPLIVLGIGYFYFEIYKLRDGFSWSGFLRIIGTASAVSVVEELLFRGVLLGLAVRFLGRWPGLILISAVFSIVHFLRPRGEILDVQWWSGFALLGSALHHEQGPAVLLSGALALFVIGLLLGGAAFATRSLWLPIGLHAGWVLGQQTINLVGKFRIKPADELLPWVGPNVVSGMVPTGLVPMAALLATGALVWWYLARARPANGQSAPAGARIAG